MIVSQIERNKYFNYLLSSVVNCDICNRMCDRKKVLSLYNGNLNSKVVFIAEAPGRLGAECTGIPLYGDKTGENFEMLLSNIGWKREDIFITNAILCNPQDINGNNSTPTQEEIENCSYYLGMTLELINPDIVVTLGVKALEALKSVKSHNYALKDCVAKKLSWNGRYLFPLYHMSPRAAIHRNTSKQRADFITLSHIVDPVRGLKNQVAITKQSVAKSANANNILLDMVVAIITELKTVSFFKLTKLLYLIDYNYYKEFGTSMSGNVYLRMQEGPWIPNLRNIAKEFDKKLFSTTFVKGKPVLSHKENGYVNELTDEQQQYIKVIVKKYVNSTDAAIKIAAYRTAPMRYILTQEKAGRNMTRTPVLYKDTSVLDVDKKDG